ncbi:autotransporter outer membrane beta-barrel domain-containing protein [Enterobacter roggenkampii]|nr:autotransporter outer membrane beta-barrel domain-containing protein [Enterobacter roggenkampii]
MKLINLSSFFYSLIKSGGVRRSVVADAILHAITDRRKVFAGTFLVLSSSVVLNASADELNIDGESISTSTAGSNGITANTGTTINISNSDIATSADGSYGISANGGTINASNIDVSTLGGVYHWGGSVRSSAGVVAEFGGSLALTGENTVSTSGANGTGLYAQTNSTGLATLIQVSGKTNITTAGNAAAGVETFGAGSAIEGSGITVSTQGDNASGALSYGGNLTLSYSAFSTTGVMSHGVEVLGSGSASLADSLISTAGERAFGAHVLDGTLNLDSVQLQTSGNGAYGLDSNGETSVLTANNVNVKTQGANSPDGTTSAGAVAEFGGSLSITGASTVATTGENAIGLLAQVSGPVSQATVLNADGGTDTIKITTTGDYARGVQACSLTSGSGDTCISEVVTVVPSLSPAALVTLNNVIITTSGTAAHGVYAVNSGSTVTAGNVSVNTSGAGAAGLNVQNGATVSLTGSNVTAAGENAAGILTGGGNADFVNQISLSGVSVSSAQSEGISAVGAVADVSLKGSTVEGGSGISVQAQSASGGDVTLMNIAADSSSLLEGDVLAGDGNTLNLSLTNASVLNGAIVNGNDISIDDSSAWMLPHDSDVQTLDLAGTVNFINGPSGYSMTRSASVFSTLTVSQAFNGNGGTLVMNTALGGDNSPTDRLVINGDTAGTTNVQVNNAGGSGAPTVQGIELISVSGNSGGEFVQKGRIVAGAWDYTLVRGQGSNNKNWYLTNNGELPSPPDTPNPPSEGNEGTSSAARVRPEAKAYADNMMAANTLFSMTLHDRLGETHYVDAFTGEEKVTSLWLRQTGGHNRSGDSAGQNKTLANRYVAQLGGDLAQWSRTGSDRFHFGVMGGYASQSGRTLNNLSGYSARSTTEGYSAGLYGTWLQDNTNKTGAYVDTWMLYNWFNNSVTPQGLLAKSYKSDGITASVEGGYTLKMGEKNSHESYFIQPQAQITWMGVKADDFTEDNGTVVQSQGNNNVQTRLGVRAFIKGNNASLDSNTGRVFEPFVEANWLHNTKDFGVAMNGVPVKVAGTRDIGELKAGVEAKVSKHVNLWGNVAQQIGDKGYSDTSALIGLKYNF